MTKAGGMPIAWVETKGDDLGGLTVVIGGELDLSSVDSVRKQIDAALSPSTRVVTLDLANLTFMDSSGIALLIQTANKVDEIVVRNPSSAVRRVIEVTGLGKWFGMDP